jgi:glutathione synthase
MEIGFVVNDVGTERPEYTTIHLALAALQRGHRAWFMGVGDFASDPDHQLRARVRGARRKRYRSGEAYLKELQGEKAVRERIQVSDLDVLLLRNDPAADVEHRPWAQAGGIIFGVMALRQGVLVLNHPATLANAINKTYFQDFPSAVRPRTLITREADEIRDFAAEQKGRIVLKPLQGSGGQNVFLVRSEEESVNLNQMIEAIGRDGYIVAQEYLPAAKEGDVRMFVMNGEPLEQNGRYAAFRRVPAEGEARSNMHRGGRAEPAEMTDEMLAIAEAARPKLLQDGMFLVGLDIVGDKLIEVNVFSPGGLHSAEVLQEARFTELVIESLEQKVEHKATGEGAVDNVTLATL